MAKVMRYHLYDKVTKVYGFYCAVVLFLAATLSCPLTNKISHHVVRCSKERPTC